MKDVPAEKSELHLDLPSVLCAAPARAPDAAAVDADELVAFVDERAVGAHVEQVEELERDAARRSQSSIR